LAARHAEVVQGDDRKRCPRGDGDIELALLRLLTAIWGAGRN